MQNIPSQTKSLKIALVCDDSLDRPDGVQQFVVTLGKWLIQQGHEVHFLTSTTARTDLPNLHVLSKNFEAKFNGNRLKPPMPSNPKEVRRLLAQQAYDIIHVQMPYSPLLAGQVVQFAPRTSTIVGTFHILPDSKFVTVSARALGFVLSLQLKKFSAFTSTSQPTKEFMKQTYHCNSEVIPNMTDVSRFSVHSVPEKGPVKVIFLGRLVERKGAGYLLQAVNHMRKLGLPTTEFQIHIGGKGVLHDQLVSYVSDNSLQNIVHFDGFVAEEDKGAYLASSDVAVFPSTGGESFGISVIEAMAATRGAVLAGNNPGYASVIGKHTSQLVDPRDIDTFAHTLARYIDNPADRAVARSWQRQDVRQYDISVVGKQFEQFYYRTLQNSKL